MHNNGRIWLPIQKPIKECESMSGNQYKSFFDEIQERFVWIVENYNPYGFGIGCLKIRLIPKHLYQDCPNCGYGKTYVHEHKPREIHGGTFNGVPVLYDLDQLRHICPICGVTFVDDYDCLPWMHSNTEEAENYRVFPFPGVKLYK